MTITAVAPHYRIGELADSSGLSVHTVRWPSLLSRLRESGMPVSVMSRYAELEACRTVIRSKIGSYRQHLGEKTVVGA